MEKEVHTKEIHHKKESPGEEKIRIKIDKRILIGAFCVIILLAIVIPLYMTREKVAAVVNGEKIYMKTLERDYQQLSQQNPSIGKAEVLNQTIATRLLLQEAKKRNIQINPAEVKLTAGKITQQPDFESKIKTLGITYDEFEKLLTEQFIIQKLINDTVQNIEVTDEEVKAFYAKNKEQMAMPESINVSHILLADRDAAESLRIQLAAGKNLDADFAKLATEKSIDPSAKTNHGNLGLVTKGQLVPEFEAPAFAIKEGTMTGPIKTQFGYHLILVHEKIPARQIPFTEVEPFIKDTIKKEKGTKAIQNLIERLYSEADIKWYLKE